MEDFLISNNSNNPIINKKEVIYIKLDIVLFCAIHFYLKNGDVLFWEYSSEQQRDDDWKMLNKKASN